MQKKSSKMLLANDKPESHECMSCRTDAVDPLIWTVTQTLFKPLSAASFLLALAFVGFAVHVDRFNPRAKNRRPRWADLLNPASTDAYRIPRRRLIFFVPGGDRL
ncbi:hypothetical protein [Paraherbaspirillum soli]|uniref:Uncharacterized protein n=1 Tax=Paraherbaspirillum soli TaxID=631222 RepID=A0ABW0M5D1_9BURK